MVYHKIKAHLKSEEDLREIWKTVYCNPERPILTFDGIKVNFNEFMFDHAFYESHERKKEDKSILSLNRLQKIYWIKDTLEDSEAILKMGWDKRKKSYSSLRRVAIVKESYIVIIQLINDNIARFITAFEIQEPENLRKVLESPDWHK